ncbi:Rv2732c family membrane protein [Mycolicibacterium thermoresistibile]
MWVLSSDGPDRDRDDLDEFRSEIEAAERRLAGEFDPGSRALVVAILVFVLLVTFILPHTGGARGWDVLLGGEAAGEAGVSLPSRLFGWFTLVFSVGFSMIALLTRRWALAWVALAGSALASVFGMLAVWSRQTAPEPYPGPGFGLIIAWIAVVLLTFHWTRAVWARTELQMAAEADRRRQAAARHQGGLLESLDSDTRSPDLAADPDTPDGPDTAEGGGHPDDRGR